MIYRDFKGEKLSALGLGTMRMPVVDGKQDSIGEAKAREMVDLAMKNGIITMIPHGCITAAIPKG